MNAVEAVFAILGTAVTVLGAQASLIWWAYKRGQAAGEEKAGRDAARAVDKAKIEAIERMLAETRAELAAMRPKRRQA